MATTTVKVSTATRDRLRSFERATLEDTIIDALDALEAAEFSRQAEQFAAWRAALTAKQRREFETRERELDAVSGRLW